MKTLATCSTGSIDASPKTSSVRTVAPYRRRGQALRFGQAVRGKGVTGAFAPVDARERDWSNAPRTIRQAMQWPLPRPRSGSVPTIAMTSAQSSTTAMSMRRIRTIEACSTLLYIVHVRSSGSKFPACRHKKSGRQRSDHGKRGVTHSVWETTDMSIFLLMRRTTSQL